MSIYPTEQELKDIDLIARYFDGDLTEVERKAVEERVEIDSLFAQYFEEGKVFFDPVENLIYEINNEKEIEQARQNFQEFVNGVNDQLCTLEQIAERLPKRFSQTKERNDLFTSNWLEVIEIKNGRLKYWEDLRAPSVCCTFDLPITHIELLEILSVK